MSVVTRLPKPAGQLGALCVIGAAFGGQVAGAVAPDAWLLAVSAAAGLAAEFHLHRRHRRLGRYLARARADVQLRQLLRDMLLMAGLMNLEQRGPGPAYIPVCYGLLLCYALHFACQATAVKVRRTRTLPVLTRNVDASELRLSPAPPALLARQAGARLLLFGLPATAGLGVAAVTGVATCAAAGIGASLVLGTGGLLVLLARLLPSRRPASDAEVLEWFDGWLRRYRPTVGMYFSGGTSSAYQANMWLEPLAGLGGRPLIVLRERFMVQKIAATDVPIVCLPKVAHLMRLEHSTLSVLIHPANSGKTSQVLRIPTIKHAFVNHGESDKLSSCNPYAKAYDEVWVAGPAARARYALADVGVDDRDVVEVGRPQLAAIAPYAGAPEGRALTVLYAPTWEGWDGNPGNTSVIEAGEHLVRALLADPGVRLLYKPHPMTGSVDPRAAAANLRVKELIRAATGRTSMPVTAELAARTAELEKLGAARGRAGADACERMALQSAPVPGRAAAVARATELWETAYWAALPPAEHRIVTGARPGVYSCFNQADLLISDVSSVVCDYLASGKPYAVANTSGLPEAEFREAFPTVGAATVLGPDGRGVAALLASVRDPAGDRLRGAREALAGELLGPADPPSPVRFRRAVEALAARSAAHRERSGSAAVPGQRGHQEAVRTPVP